MRQKRYWYIITAVLCCGMAAASLGLCVNAYGVFLTPVSEALHVTRASVSLHATLFSLAAGFMAPAVNALIPRTGVRKLLFGGVLLTSLSTAGMALASLKYEELTVKNVIPTAEGAISIAMEKSKITLHDSNCLVLGFGRIGKILAKMLHGLGAHVCCEARKQHDLAWIKAYGYNGIHLNNLNERLNEFDFIFNTIPNLILDKTNLELVKKECILIDLASKPGGIDFEEADRLGLQNEWALALPGKVAPKTSAQYIYELIKDIL